MGEIEYGKCDFCGEEGPLTRTYFYYGIKCECHSPEHFEMKRHCKKCDPTPPLKTEIYLTPLSRR